MRVFLIFLILLSSFLSSKPKPRVKELDINPFHIDVLNQYYKENINLRRQYETVLKVNRSRIYRGFDEASKSKFLRKKLYHSTLLIYGIDNSMSVRDYNKKFFPKAVVIGTVEFRFVSPMTHDELKEFANYKIADVLVVRSFFNIRRNLYYYEMELLYFPDPKKKEVSIKRSLNRVKGHLAEYLTYNSKSKPLSTVEVEKTYALATLEDFQEKQKKAKEAAVAKAAQDPKQPFQKNTKQAAKEQKNDGKNAPKAKKTLSAIERQELKEKQKEEKMKKLLFFAHYSGTWLDVETGYLYNFFYSAPYDHEIVQSEYKSDFVTYLSKGYVIEQKKLAEEKAKEEAAKKAQATKANKNVAAKNNAQPAKVAEATNKNNQNLTSFLGQSNSLTNNAQNANQNKPNVTPKKGDKEEEYSGIRGFKSEEEMNKGKEKKYYVVTGIIKGRIASNPKAETFNPAYRSKPRDLLIKFNTYDGRGLYVDNDKNIKEVTVKPEPRKNYIVLLLPNGEKRYLVHVNEGVNPRSIYKLYVDGTQPLPTSEKPSYLFEQPTKGFNFKKFYEEYPASIVGISLLVLALLA